MERHEEPNGTHVHPFTYAVTGVLLQASHESCVVYDAVEELPRRGVRVLSATALRRSAAKSRGIVAHFPHRRKIHERDICKHGVRRHSASNLEARKDRLVCSFGRFQSCECSVVE
jgi:hypothetical protein